MNARAAGCGATRRDGRDRHSAGKPRIPADRERRGTGPPRPRGSGERGNGGWRCAIGRSRRPDASMGRSRARHGLCAGGRARHAAHGADRQARQARGVLRRQVAHHRLRPVERAQLRHPPDRGRDPVQGAQPDPSPAARLELPPPRAQRELRHPAGQPARLRATSGISAPPTRCIQNIDIIDELRAATTSSSWRATTSTRWTTS